MNIFTIASFIILLVIFVYLLITIISSFKEVMKRIPKGIFVILFFVVVGMMAFIIRGWIKGIPPGGIEEASISGTEGDPDNEELTIVETYDNCIHVKEDQILVNNELVSDEELDKYIIDKARDGEEIVIVDNYSSYESFEKVINKCEEKNVRHDEKDENWFNN